MIHNCNSVAPLTFSWHTLLSSISNSVLEDPAVYLDHDSLQCYIHGGKCDARGDGHIIKKMSTDLIRIDLSRFLITSPVKIGTSSGGLRVSLETAAPKSNLNEASAFHLLYTDNPISKCPLITSEADSGIISNQPVLRHSHILFRHGSFLVLHGGWDDNGMVCNNMLAFHLISRCWEDIKTLYGGDASPRMYGHAVAPINTAKGLFLVMGVECNPNGTFMPSRKRSRSKGPGTNSCRTVMGRPPNAQRSGLSIYTLRLEDRLEGWRKVGISDAATHGPCARVYFSINIPHSSFTAASDASLDCSEEPPIGGVAYLAGGRISSTYLVDVWRYDLTTGHWREVVLPPHPTCDRKLSPSLAVHSLQTRAPSEVRRDRRVNPYAVRLVPLIYSPPKGPALQNGDGNPLDESGKWTEWMTFLLKVPRRESSQNWSSSPLPSLAALCQKDESEGSLPMGLLPEETPTLLTVPVTKCGKLSMALETFLAVDSEATPWLFYLSRDKRLDVVRVQGLLLSRFQVKR
ncbi:unnamed protein product [Phytomonas sp. Hart1]|nr:unnamed protein product [Phytomonas sp. Hart1]|eukprot:CCW69356.1 unnamed protein product [Phytomonas sp. isolate Hart1]